MVLQKSGELAVYMGLNAENEIIHTLSFLAGMMIWSQVWILSLLLNRLPISVGELLTSLLFFIYFTNTHCIAKVSKYSDEGEPAGP